jgi:hypothetical protein
MTGIMIAVAGGARTIIYASGLYTVETNTVQQSPVTGSTITTGFVTVTRNWIGYFLSPSTGSISLGIQTSNFSGSGGGSASTVGRLWLGDNAAAGNDAAADVTASGNQTVNAIFNLVQGIYYPLRVRWNGSYSGGSTFFGSTSSGGSISFLASGSTDVTGTIFYNSAANGF